MRKLYNSNVHNCAKPFLLAAPLHLSGGRKILQDGKMDKAKHQSPWSKDPVHNEDKSLSTSKIIGMVVPGTFAVCCVSLCAWFYGRRKPTAHTMLSKDLNSSKYSTSLVYGPKDIYFGTVYLFLFWSSFLTRPSSQWIQFPPSTRTLFQKRFIPMKSSWAVQLGCPLVQ